MSFHLQPAPKGNRRAPFTFRGYPGIQKLNRAGISKPAPFQLPTRLPKRFSFAVRAHGALRGNKGDLNRMPWLGAQHNQQKRVTFASGTNGVPKGNIGDKDGTMPRFVIRQGHQTFEERVQEILESKSYPREWDRLRSECRTLVLTEAVKLAPSVDLDDWRHMDELARNLSKNNVVCSGQELAELLRHERHYVAARQPFVKIDMLARAEEIMALRNHPPVLNCVNRHVRLRALAGIVRCALRQEKVSPERLAVKFNRDCGVIFTADQVASLFKQEQRHRDSLEFFNFDKAARPRSDRIQRAILHAFDGADPSNHWMIEDEVVDRVNAKLHINLRDEDVLLILKDAHKIDLVQKKHTPLLTAQECTKTGVRWNERYGRPPKSLEEYSVWTHLGHPGRLLYAKVV